MEIPKRYMMKYKTLIICLHGITAVQYLESRTAEIDALQVRHTIQNPKSPGLLFIVSGTLCEFCKGKEHFIRSRPNYLTLPIPHHFDYVNSSKLCINCLKKWYVVTQCPSKTHCRICHIIHHFITRMTLTSLRTHRNSI